MLDRLDRELICDAKTRGIAEIRARRVEHACEIVRCAGAVLQRELVVTTPKFFVLGAMNEADRPTTRAVEAQFAAVGIEDVASFAAAGVGVIEPKFQPAQRNLYVIQAQVDV